MGFWVSMAASGWFQGVREEREMAGGLGGDGPHSWGLDLGQDWTWGCGGFQGDLKLGDLGGQLRRGWIETSAWCCVSWWGAASESPGNREPWLGESPAVGDVADARQSFEGTWLGWW